MEVVQQSSLRWHGKMPATASLASLLVALRDVRIADRFLALILIGNFTKNQVQLVQAVSDVPLVLHCELEERCVPGRPVGAFPTLPSTQALCASTGAWYVASDSGEALLQQGRSGVLDLRFRPEALGAYRRVTFESLYPPGYTDAIQSIPGCLMASDGMRKYGGAVNVNANSTTHATPWAAPLQAMLHWASRQGSTTTCY